MWFQDAVNCCASFGRYEDNFDAVNNLILVAEKTDKGSISDFGAPDKFLESVQYLFGKQAFAGTVHVTPSM